MKWFLSLNRQSFTVRIFFYLMVAIGMCVCMQMAIHLCISDKNLRKEMLQEGQSFLRIYAQAARPAIYAEDRIALVRVSDALLQHGEISDLVVVDNNLQILYQSTQDNSKEYKKSSLPLEQFNLDYRPTEDSSSFLFSVKEKSNAFQFVAPVFTTPASDKLEDLYSTPSVSPQYLPANGEKIGYIRLGFDKKRLRKNQHTAFKTVLLVAAFMLLFSSVVTYFISRAASAPVRRIIAEMRKRNALPSGEGELEILSGAFDSMIKSLGEAFNTITDLKTNLEIRVQERTADLAHANAELEQRQAELAASNRTLEEALVQLRQTQAQLVHSEKMVAMGQLVAGVAHEINNTTNFISGALPPLSSLMEKIKARLSSLESNNRAELVNYFASMETLLGNIREGVRRTIRIVQDLRTFSRSSSEKDICQSDVHTGLDSTLNLMHNEIKYKAHVVRDYGENLPRICCNPSQINQVFMNILLNAVQSLPEKGMGTITLKTWQEGDNVHVAITDTGKGISEAILPRIFDPFFTTKPIGKGTGLGLSIAYGIVEKHRGRIFVKSEEGKGTTFEVVLPVECDMV